MIFRGFRVGHEAVVQVEDGGQIWTLDPRYDVRIHDVQGFDWGKDTKGAHQLALALLYEVSGGDAETAEANVKHCVEEILVDLAQSWTVTDTEVVNTIYQFSHSDAS